MRSARAGLWNEAIFRWQRVVVARPADAQLHNNLAVAFENQGRFDEARREYERAVDLAPDNEYIRRNLEAFENFITKRPDDTVPAGLDGAGTATLEEGVDAHHGS